MKIEISVATEHHISVKEVVPEGYERIPMYKKVRWMWAHCNQKFNPKERAFVERMGRQLAVTHFPAAMTKPQLEWMQGLFKKYNVPEHAEASE